MTNTSKPNSPSFRFLFIGGWTAVKGATIGSVFAVLVTLTILGVYGIWQNGIQTINFTTSGVQSFSSSVALMLLVAILLSVFPAFIGGVFLAWLLDQKNSKTSISNPSKLNLGAWIGASAGIVLTLLVLIPADFVGRTAHGGYGYNILESLPIYSFYAIEIIVIATFAGMWTDRQLRKYLENARPNNTG
jgi:Ni,Fe-hydrogenase I cytochrome b subunit